MLAFKTHRSGKRFRGRFDPRPRWTFLHVTGPLDMGSRGGQHRSLGGRQKYSTDQVIVHDLSRTMESSTVPGSLHQTHDFRCLETRGSSGHLWNLRALGRVCSALRRLFWSPRSARFEERIRSGGRGATRTRRETPAPSPLRNGETARRSVGRNRTALGSVLNILNPQQKTTSIGRKPAVGGLWDG